MSNERDMEALAEVIGAAYYDSPKFTIPDAADGPHFLNAARAVAERTAQARREGAAEAWNEGWNAAVDSNGFPGDVNPYRDDTAATP